MVADTKSTIFTCSLADATNPFPHFWEHTVGSCHATLALRADWQQQSTRSHRELGFKHVRFHGILCDDMCTLIDEEDKLIYSFFNADQICDFLLSIGMKPFVELSFMPTTLSSGNTTVFRYLGNVTPPRDYNAWATLIHNLVSHWVERYGITEVSQWFFEVWNEPNLSQFWTGTQADYFHLYQCTAQAIKNVHPDLQVGGPASGANAWITDFISFCGQNKVPFDFVTTHHYPTDAFGEPGDDTITRLAASRRSVLKEQVAQAYKEAKGNPLYYTEWNTSSNPFDELHDTPYAAAFIVKTVMEARGYVDGYSYWTFSDIFEENYFSSAPFHGGFGLLNIYGIPKPSYRAFQLLHSLGNEALAVSGQHDTADVWITRQQGAIKVLVTNWALPRHPVKQELIQIQLNNLNFKKIRKSFVERIDDDHANAHKAWLGMGSPGSLTPLQASALERESLIIKETFDITQSQDNILLELIIPAQGIACITLETE